MIILVYLLTIALFCLAFYLTDMIKTARVSIAISRQAIEIISDPDLEDFAKETSIKKAATEMMKNCGLFFLKGGLTVAAVAIPLLSADLMDLASIAETSRFALRWDVLILTTLAMMLSIIILKKLRTHHSSTTSQISKC